MSKISQNIVDQIKEEKITPKPRWQFVLRNALLMAAVILAIVIGGLVMSLVFLKVGELDWEFVSLYGEHGLPRIFEVLPLLWMLTLVLVLLLAVWSFEKTESAYKIRPAWVVGGSVLASLLLAGVLYAVRGPELMDVVLRTALPGYDQMERERAERFHLPALGGLPGRVLELRGDNAFELEDLKQNLWTVEVRPDSKAQRVFGILREGQMILVIGEEEREGLFLADDIRAKRGLMLKIRSNVVPRPKQVPGEGRVLPLSMPAPMVVP